VSSTKIIATADMAEIVAGAIAMGLGGYLAARTDQEHYESEERREFAEVEDLRDREIAEVETIFTQYGLTGGALACGGGRRHVRPSALGRVHDAF
jgi:hypothetical protein